MCTLKDAAQFRLIGKPLPRLDTPDKVDGSAEFGLDVQLPGMLYAVIALSPTLGGKVQSVDSSAASGNAGRAPRSDHREWSRCRRGPLLAGPQGTRCSCGSDWDHGPQWDLDNAGDLVAARQGCRQARRFGAQAERRFPPPSRTVTRPRPSKKAAKTFSAVYELPMLAHATMEPMNCTADVKADRCDVYVGTQVQQMAQAAAAEAAGLKPDQVNVHTTLLGGGFGRRLEVDFVPAAVEASKAVGAPVKLIWTREDDMTHDYYRPPAREAVTAGLDEKGQLLAWALHVTSPSITARFDPTNKNPFDSVIEYVQNFPYAVANFDLRYTRQEIGIDVGYLRSVSHAPNCFAIESSIDELRPLASRNPLDFRLELLAGKPRHTRVLELVAERSGWGQAPQGSLSGYRLHGRLHLAHRPGGGGVSRGRPTQGPQDHLCHRLRADRQSAHRRIAARERHRLWPVGRALGRHHAAAAAACNSRISTTTACCA